MFTLMRRACLLACPAIVLAVPTLAQNIYTVAGGPPNNIPAVSAALFVSSVAVDTAGDAYIASCTRVFRVDNNGQITLYAGNGLVGFSGDGGPATNAEFCANSIAVDGAGNVFIGESNRIRRVDAVTHVITTASSNIGAVSLAVDGGGDVFGADGVIFRMDAATGAVTNVASAPTGSSSGVAVDTAGNVFFSVSFGGNSVYRVDTSTGNVTLVAGNGLATCQFCQGGYSGDGGPATAAQLNNPSGVAVDSAGNLFIADAENFRVRRVDAATGIITTVAGDGVGGSGGDGGAATAAELSSLLGVAFDSNGNLLIQDDTRVRRVDTATQIITTIAGNGTSCFSGDGGPAASAQLCSAAAVTSDSQGNLFIADTENHRIRRIDAATQVITTVAGNGHQEADGEGGYAGDGGPAASAELNFPQDVAVDKMGNLFIADHSNARIRRVDGATGTITTVAGNGMGSYGGDGGPAISAGLVDPTSVVVDSAENLFIGDDFFGSRVRRVDASTGIINTFAGNGNPSFSGDGGPATSAGLHYRGFLAVDTAGNLFIPDAHNFRLRRVDAATSIITTVAGDGRPGFSGDGGPATAAGFSFTSLLGGPAVDNAGDLFIGDFTRVRRVDAQTQIINTIAGDGTQGFGGDGGPATSAELFLVGRAALDQLGNLFIGDVLNSDNSRVREVVVGKKSQRIAFGGIADRVLVPGDSFVVAGTASSNLDVTFTVGATDSCTISGTTVQITGVGSCTVTAHQTGNDFYNAAPDVAQSFRILYAAAGQACDAAPGHAILPPINADGSTMRNQGSTIPAQFRVCDGNGNSVGTPSVVASFNFVAGSGTVNSTTSNAQFRWDPTNQLWIYNIDTTGLAAGSTYMYQILLNDGTTIAFQFGLK